MLRETGVVIQQRMTTAPAKASSGFMGMIGFDIACETARSGPRMQGYLVNDLCEPIVADAKRNDFALAA